MGFEGTEHRPQITFQRSVLPRIERQKVVCTMRVPLSFPFSPLFSFAFSYLLLSFFMNSPLSFSLCQGRLTEQHGREHMVKKGFRSRNDILAKLDITREYIIHCRITVETTQ